MLLRGSSHARLANSSRALKSDLTTSGSLLLPQGPARGRAPRAAPGDRGPGPRPGKAPRCPLGTLWPTCPDVPPGYTRPAVGLPYQGDCRWPRQPAEWTRRSVRWTTDSALAHAAQQAQRTYPTRILSARSTRIWIHPDLAPAHATANWRQMAQRFWQELRGCRQQRLNPIQHLHRRRHQSASASRGPVLFYRTLQREYL